MHNYIIIFLVPHKMEHSLFSRPFGPHYSLFQYDALLTVKAPRKQQSMAGLLIRSPTVCSIIKQCTHNAEEASHLFMMGSVFVVCASEDSECIPPSMHPSAVPTQASLMYFRNTPTSSQHHPPVCACFCLCVCRSVCVCVCVCCSTGCSRAAQQVRSMASVPPD